MKYNILVISDLHWGVVDPDEQKLSLEFFMEFIRQYSDNIDLIVIAGDYWDRKLSLNSKSAIIAIEWFHQLYDICKDSNIIIRMILGTADHDNDQLKVFEHLVVQDQPSIFNIFYTMTVEETLPDFVCCYCPDELIKTDEYEDLYLNDILQLKDMGFFHGTFDLVYGDLLEAKPELMDKNNVIFRYGFWAPQIKGPLISGHWHDGKKYGELYYTGSPFRWKFKEDEDKGFVFVQYDTEDSSYFIRKIVNPIAAKYLTYEIYTNTFDSKDDYIKILKDIHSILNQLEQSNTNDKLRILFYVVDDKDINEVFLSALRQEIINHKNCKIVIKDKLKDKKKKASEKKTKEEKEQVNFIFEKSIDKSVKIHDYIMKESEMDIPMDFIKKKINQYL